MMGSGRIMLDIPKLLRLVMGSFLAIESVFCGRYLVEPFEMIL